jgi:uncharacterized repeat protein (TIGR03803 family)
MRDHSGGGRRLIVFGLAISLLTGALVSGRSALAVDVDVVKSFTLAPQVPQGASGGHDGNVYVTTSFGGAGTRGAIVRIEPPGTMTVIHSFSGPDGAFPSPSVLQVTTGVLYGTTASGGASDCGTVFKIDTDGSFTSLHSFACLDGAAPSAALTEATNGALYGTTPSGGASGCGSVFKIDMSGAFTSLHSFSCVDGAYPFASLVQADNGALYGTTSGGGPLGAGSVFKVDPAADDRVTSFHFFNGNGANPLTALVQANGALYGTTPSGSGATLYGTVFKVDPAADAVTVIHVFNNGNGASPFAALVQATNGALYGTTSSGSGATANGTLFKIDPTDAVLQVHVFSGTDGAFPGSLVPAGNGLVYGITGGGGASGFGTVFKVTADLVTAIHSFNVSSDGMSFGPNLVQAGDGSIYGTTAFAGVSGVGMIFRVDATDGFSLLNLNSLSSDGFSPYASLIEGSDGALYGTTPFGGASGCGTAFKLDGGGTFTVVHSFTCSDGAYPNQFDQNPALIRASNGALYGATPFGGAAGCGTVFKIDSSGAFTSLHSFSCSDGAYPFASLVQADNDALYGTTSAGGESGAGTVFKVDTGDSVSMIHAFAGSEGANPVASLVQAGNGALYGTTGLGGASGYGTVFKIDITDDGVSLIHSFSYDDGASPRARLVKATNGGLYGITNSGGASNAGTVFKIDPTDDGFTLIHSFTESGGSGPYGSLVQASNGALYGTTVAGGVFSNGTVFRVDTDTATLIHSFAGADGASPFVSLVEAGDGALYGTTVYGGDVNAGTVFKVDTSDNVSSIHSFAGSDGASPYTSLVKASNGALYGAAFEKGPAGGGVLYRVSVARAAQTIAFETPADRMLGDPPFSVTATASSGLPVTFSASGSCSISENTVTLTAVGSCTIVASQSGNGSYLPAEDVARTFAIHFNFSGFFQPVDNLPTLNEVSAGRGVPVKFSLGSNQGLNILAAGSPASVGIGCSTSMLIAVVEETVTVGSSTLTYDAITNQYTYVWKTDSGWRGTCRQLIIRLTDGTDHRANFKFK